MSLSVTLPAKKFQLFHPIGGVAATFCAPAPTATPSNTTAQTTLATNLARIDSPPSKSPRILSSPQRRRKLVPQARRRRVTQVTLRSYAARYDPASVEGCRN